MTDLVRIFKALGDESRLRILLALSEESYCVCDLAKCLGIAQPTLSHHLKILRDVGLVIGEKEGQWIFCRINYEMLDRYGLDLSRLFGMSEATAMSQGVGS